MGYKLQCPDVGVQGVPNVRAVLGGDIACTGGVGAVGRGAGLALGIPAPQPAVVGLPAEGCARVLLVACFGVEDAVGS